MKSSTLLVAAAVAVLGGSYALADYVPVYGGQTYDSLFAGAAQSTVKVSYFNVGDGIATNDVSEWGTAGYTSLPSILSPNPPANRLRTTTIYGTSYKAPSDWTVHATRAVLWNAAGQIVEMAYPGATNNLAGSYVSQANAGGISVGAYYQQALDSNNLPVDVYRRPLRWNADGSVATPLGVLGTDANGNAFGEARVINDSSTIAGTVQKWVNNVNTGMKAVRWAAGSTTAEELPQPLIAGSTQSTSYALQINAVGTIAGVANYSGGVSGRSAVRWDAGSNTATVLDGLTTAVDGKYGYTTVYGLNDAGTVVGVATSTSGVASPHRAVRWDSGGAAITVLGLLGNPPATINTYAFGINNAGLTVGMQRVGGAGGGTAVMWGLDGIAIDLNTFVDPASGWTLIEADDISDSNWVAGIGRFDPDGAGPQAAYQRAFLIQVPEPMAGLFALAALPLLRRRRA